MRVMGDESVLPARTVDADARLIALPHARSDASVSLELSVESRVTRQQSGDSGVRWRP